MKNFKRIAGVMLAVFLIAGIASAQAYKPYVKTLELTVQGVPVFESGLGLNSEGVEWFVNSNATGTDAGTSWTNASLTIDAAINLATASNGDIIHIAATHAETYSAADGFDLDKAGLTLVFHGEGENQANLTFGHADATVACGAANNTIYGGRYLAGIDIVTAGIMVEAACDNLTMVGPVFPEPTTSGWEFVDAIDLAALADGFHIYNPVQRTADASGAAHFIEAGNGVNIDLQVINADLIGEYSVAAIWSDDADEEVIIRGGAITNMTTGQHAVEMTGADGIISDIILRSDIEASTLDPGSMAISNVCWDDDTTDDVMCVPITDQGTTSVLADADGTDLERLEYLAQMSEQVLAGLEASGRSVGNVWYVDSVTGASGDDGSTWALAEALIVQGIGDAASSKGDIVFLAPGHAETISAATAIDKIGLTIIGLGTGEEGPTVTMNAAISSFDISVAGVWIKNLNLYNTTAATDNAFDLTADADYTVLEDIELRDTEAGNFVFTIGVKVATGTDNLAIRGWDVYNVQSGATSLVDLTTGITTGFKFEDNDVWGDYSAGALSSDKALTNIRVRGNTIRNIQAGDHAIELSAAATGYINDNILAGTVPGQILDPGSALAFDNRIVESDMVNADTRGMMEDGWFYSTATFELDGAANTDAVFTVTGLVEVKVFGEVTETVTSHGDTFAVGIVDSTVLLIAATAGNAPMVVGDVWTTATIAKGTTAPSTFVLDGDNITVIQSGTNLTDGTVIIHVYWRPLEELASVITI